MPTQNQTGTLRTKILALAGILFLLTVAWIVIRETINDRSYHREEASSSVAMSWTGAQTLTLPVLVVSYTTRYTDDIWNKESQRYEDRVRLIDHTEYVPLPNMQVDVELKATSLERGIFEVPVFDAQVKVRGVLDATAIASIRLKENFDSYGETYLGIGVSDQRGISTSPRYEAETERFNLKAGSGLHTTPSGFRVMLDLPVNLEPGEFSLSFGVKGMSSFQLVPTAENLEAIIHSNWQHPSFTGAYLPDTRTINDEGYLATWSTNRFSSAVRQNLALCATGACEQLSGEAYGVKHIDPVDHYLKSERATKYGILVVLLVFSSFLLVEILKSLAVHPVSYLLVGSSLCLFYLLLVALAEHIGFGPAYLISAVACAIVIAYYMEYQLGAETTLVFGSSLLLVYGILYLVILSEDFAFMSGSIILFVALTTIMMTTRKVNWHEWGEQSSDADATEN